MNDLMIDLETLDIVPSAVVVAIGVVRFNARAEDDALVHEELRLRLSHSAIDDQVRRGRTVSGSTLSWWMTQPKIARHQAFNVGDGASMPVALAKLAGIVGVDDLVWGNGAGFDLAILRSLYASFGHETPWKYKQERCYRTLRSIAKERDAACLDDDDAHVTTHVAVEDAAHQAFTLRRIYRELKL